MHNNRFCLRTAEYKSLNVALRLQYGSFACWVDEVIRMDVCRCVSLHCAYVELGTVEVSGLCYLKCVLR